MLERLKVFSVLIMAGFISMGFLNVSGGKGILWWIWLIIIIAIILFLIWLMFVPVKTKPKIEENVEQDKLVERTREVIKEDDLKLIEGIGPKISKILKEHGIKTFKDLSNKKPEEIKKILESKGIRGIADPTTWPEQAKLASEGKFDELKELQKRLKGGRRV